MTTEGEQQGAVCGTCGGSGNDPWRGSSDGPLPCLDCNGTGRIPAPVVPSDDERCDECGHVLTWGCHGPAQDRLISINGGELEFPHPWHAPGTGGMYADKQRHAAPPTPSQDAEGDGRVPSWTIGSWPPPRGTVVLHFRHHDDFNGVELPAQEARELAFMLLDRAMSADGDANWWANDARREAIESAIRAPYEELVAALDAALAEAHPHFHPFNCEVCRIKAQEIRPRKAALESLGGRS